MFLKDTQDTQFDLYLLKFFSKYKSTILSLHKKDWNKEDLKGESKIKYEINYYYYAFIYTLLIRLELNDGIKTDKEYYYDKYNILSVTKCFACFNINLKDLFTLFDISFEEDTENGIGIDQIEETFIIEEDTELEQINVAIEELLKTAKVCSSIFDDEPNSINVNNYIPPISGGGGTGGENVVTAKLYFGNSIDAALDEIGIAALASITTTTPFNTFVFTGAGYKYVAVDVALGVINNLKDTDTNFIIALSPVYQVTFGGRTYNVYRSFYSLGDGFNAATI